MDPARLDRELIGVSDRGWAKAVEELEEGYAAVGAPVRDHDGRAVAVGRPGRYPDLTRTNQALPALDERLLLLEGPELDISSTALRKRVAAGRPIRYQTPDAVVAYIVEHGLYR